ncbi:hypothetical protein EVAR_19105_1 [Eumeta japonica]|uniref:Uncharacterized protein n=1 Tax=Eumeta variegata TaxID=151549 RepID=A0A4C1UPA0_EUMVA|nr:hypothetical protein EVAR_19105_1 [Eumeta japonica]
MASVGEYVEPFYGEAIYCLALFLSPAICGNGQAIPSVHLEREDISLVEDMQSLCVEEEKVVELRFMCTITFTSLPDVSGVDVSSQDYSLRPELLADVTYPVKVRANGFVPLQIH